MQLESLKVFCDLCETESFTKAAQMSSVTQSAVSQTISALERKFKSLLIERSKTNFGLTPEGEIVYDYGKKMLQQFDSFCSKLQGIQKVISGNIRLASVYSIGLHEMPPYIKRFLKDYPDVNVHLEYRRHDQVYDDVLGNVIDLGLVAYPIWHARLEIVPLPKDPLVLICHPQNPFARSKSVKLKALDGQKLISFDRDMPTRKALDKIFRDQGITVQHAQEFDNIELLKAVVALDSGVAIVPEGTVKQEVGNRTLAAVPLEGTYFRELGIIYKKGKVLSPAMKEFISMLQNPL